MDITTVACNKDKKTMTVKLNITPYVTNENENKRKRGDEQEGGGGSISDFIKNILFRIRPTKITPVVSADPTRVDVEAEWEVPCDFLKRLESPNYTVIVQPSGEVHLGQEVNYTNVRKYVHYYQHDRLYKNSDASVEGFPLLQIPCDGKYLMVFEDGKGDISTQYKKDPIITYQYFANMPLIKDIEWVTPMNIDKDESQVVFHVVKNEDYTVKAYVLTNEFEDNDLTKMTVLIKEKQGEKGKKKAYVQVEELYSKDGKKVYVFDIPADVTDVTDVTGGSKKKRAQHVKAAPKVKPKPKTEPKAGGSKAKKQPKPKPKTEPKSGGSKAKKQAKPKPKPNRKTAIK